MNILTLKLQKALELLKQHFLQILYRIIQNNQEMCVVEHNARWFPCAMNEWKNYIDLWNPRQIDRIVKKLPTESHFIARTL